MPNRWALKVKVFFVQGKGQWQINNSNVYVYLICDANKSPVTTYLVMNGSQNVFLNIHLGN